MDQKYIEDLLPYSTVRIESQRLGVSLGTGTGFFYHFCETGNYVIPGIVTNKHVVEGADAVSIGVHASVQPGGEPVANILWRLRHFPERCIPHPDPDVDLCVLRVLDVYQPLEKDHHIFNFPFTNALLPDDKLLSDLSPIEDVLMIGYPNGIWDEVNNMPIFRRGITATSPVLDYLGKKEFLVDIAAFPGSSGSPILLYNPTTYRTRDGFTHAGMRISLLGILYAGYHHTAQGRIEVRPIPTTNMPVAFSDVPNNLGIAIKAERLKDFEEILLDLAGGPPPMSIPPT